MRLHRHCLSSRRAGPYQFHTEHMLLGLGHCIALPYNSNHRASASEYTYRSLQTALPASYATPAPYISSFQHCVSRALTDLHVLPYQRSNPLAPTERPCAVAEQTRQDACAQLLELSTT